MSSVTFAAPALSFVESYCNIQSSDSKAVSLVKGTCGTFAKLGVIALVLSEYAISKPASSLLGDRVKSLGPYAEASRATFNDALNSLNHPFAKRQETTSGVCGMGKKTKTIDGPTLSNEYRGFVLAGLVLTTAVVAFWYFGQNPPPSNHAGISDDIDADQSPISCLCLIPTDETLSWEASVCKDGFFSKEKTISTGLFNSIFLVAIGSSVAAAISLAGWVWTTREYQRFAGLNLFSLTMQSHHELAAKQSKLSSADLGILNRTIAICHTQRGGQIVASASHVQRVVKASFPNNVSPEMEEFLQWAIEVEQILIRGLSPEEIKQITEVK